MKWEFQLEKTVKTPFIFFCEYWNKETLLKSVKLRTGYFHRNVFWPFCQSGRKKKNFSFFFRMRWINIVLTLPTEIKTSYCRFGQIDCQKARKCINFGHFLTFCITFVSGNSDTAFSWNVQFHSKKLIFRKYFEMADPSDD